MDVRCDRCETEYELDDAIVTETGASVQCTTCGHTFVVRRRPSAPQSQTGFGAGVGGGAALPAGSQAGSSSDSSGPDIPEWTLSADDGRVHRFRDLNMLQKWIVERKVTRTDRISRLGGPWLALGDVVELGPFFTVVDEADRARAAISAPPSSRPPPGMIPPSGSRGSGAARPTASPSNPIVSTVSSPPVPPADSRRVSEDGPTVPNRRLTEAMLEQQPASSGVPSTPASARPSEPRPGIRPPDDRTPNRNVELAAARANSAAPRPSARTELVFDGGIAAETLDSDLLETSHTGRNVALAVILLLAAGAAGTWWWTEHERGAPASGGPAASRPDPAKESPRASATAPKTGSASVDKAERKAERNAEAKSDTKSDNNTAAHSDGKSADRHEGAPDPKAGSTAEAGKVAAQARAPGSAGDGQAAAAGTSAAGASAAVAPARGRTSSGAGPAKGGRVVAEAGPSLRPGTYEQLVREADRLLESGKSAKADKLYTQALAARPDGVAALTGSAYVLLDRQRHFKAIETFRRALTVQPAYGPALFGIAESYRARGDTAQALGAYRQYLAVAPTGADAPAARHQIKELESTPPPSAVERPPAAPPSEP